MKKLTLSQHTRLIEIIYEWMSKGEDYHFNGHLKELQDMISEMVETWEEAMIRIEKEHKND